MACPVGKASAEDTMKPALQFIEIVREEYARINDLKQAANERGEIAENLIRALQSGKITQQQYDELKKGRT